MDGSGALTKDGRGALMVPLLPRSQKPEASPSPGKALCQPKANTPGAIVAECGAPLRQTSAARGLDPVSKRHSWWLLPGWPRHDVSASSAASTRWLASVATTAAKIITRYIAV